MSGGTEALAHDGLLLAISGESDPGMIARMIRDMTVYSALLIVNQFCP